MELWLFLYHIRCGSLRIASTPPGAHTPSAIDRLVTINGAHVARNTGLPLCRATHGIENPSKGQRVAPGGWEIRGACLPVFARDNRPAPAGRSPMSHCLVARRPRTRGCGYGQISSCYYPGRLTGSCSARSKSTGPRKHVSDNTGDVGTGRAHRPMLLPPTAAPSCQNSHAVSAKYGSAIEQRLG